MHSKYCELFDRGWCFGVLLALSVGAPAVSAEEQAGKTIMARGTVSATAEQQNRALKRQSPVYRVDLVSTGADSSSQLRMMDGGLLSMQADTELAIRNYQFDQGRSESSVSMELLKGGLRTITGTLPQSGKIYQLDTPVATIGVRGTHYEAILQQGDLYLAGWDGIIDIKVTVPGVNAGFSLGPELPYRFAIVRANGEVEMLLGTPKIFAEQQSPILVDQSEFGGQFAQPTELESMQDWLTASKTLTMDASGLDFYDNRQLTASWDIQAMDTISRTGMATFDQLTGHSLSSTAGSLSDLSMSMDVDFDGAWVPSGQLSFTDAGGEWFAVFNGVFGAQSLELSVNFASHGNALADGNISALFIDNATGVLGNLNLFELDNPSIRLDGGFELSEQP
ncbi:MAG: FecR family protein [Gammaproteobacteria bacterium]|nr:FecR family protein [Gammaproteobacteria bacterium]MBU2279656.1 FecR family protein [Gammaproteobacteria bacterium]